MTSKETVVCIVGLGYVGLPLVGAFSKRLKVIGYDNDITKLEKLASDNDNPNLFFTTESSEIGKADFVIICVPTPVTSSSEPDLSFIKQAAEDIGKNLKKNSTVILESTVYPGVTEEVVKPILERESGLVCGKDFRIGYSPERINPGDKAHTVEKITKVVAGMDEQTTELIAGLYGHITPNIFKAKDIKTAEAAKVIENIQRDLNIALMNELSIIFEKIGLDTKEVLDAAATKWNFQRYSPGLVGGHCIPVDPYYLVYKSRELGYSPQVILAGRAINDSMAHYIATMTINALESVGKVVKGSRVLVMGLTYKENVADTRETPAKGIIEELKEYGVEVWGYDPLLSDIEGEFNIQVLKNLDTDRKYDAIIITVAHNQFMKIRLSELKEIGGSNPVIIDIRRIFDPDEAGREGFYYRTL
ncbi:nucleotide sugar dehydrogenase [Chloroflexota bacterium]